MYTTAKKTGGRALVLVVMVATMVLASTVVFAAEARAGSFDDSPPKAVLIKYENTVIQAREAVYAHWFYYDEKRGWMEYYSDSADYFDGIYPKAQVVGADRRLHVRLRKPERPSSLKIFASRTKFGQARQLESTLKPVEKDGKTVGWDAYFRVDQPDRHYYIDVYPVWDEVPGTHTSYGDDTAYWLHVRTR
jgi:hypothetical protein